jgi:hypothetical protein
MLCFSFFLSKISFHVDAYLAQASVYFIFLQEYDSLLSKIEITVHEKLGNLQRKITGLQVLAHKAASTIYIYRVRLWCFTKHKTSRASCLYLEYKSPNGRSKTV